MAACERAKINPPITFHGHTWASLSVMAGLPLMVVAKNLGHVDTRMVEAHRLAPRLGSRYSLEIRFVKCRMSRLRYGRNA